jgi:uncharacterized membrane protein
MEFYNLVTKRLGVKPPKEYAQFMERYGKRLSSDPVSQESWLSGLGDVAFVVGTTLAFRAKIENFSPQNIIIGYLGPKTIVIDKSYETIDDYLALNVTDEKVLSIDSLGATEEISDDFEQWVRPELLRAELKDEYANPLIAVLFDDELRAEEAGSKLMKLQDRGLIDLEDAVVVVKEADGSTKYHQTHQMIGKGGAVGSLTGLIVGALLMHPLIGVFLGAVTGMFSARFQDIGIHDHFIKDLAAGFNPGSSALFTLVRKSQPDKVLEEFRGFGGKILATSITKRKAAALQACLDFDQDQSPDKRPECPKWIVRNAPERPDLGAGDI